MPSEERRVLPAYSSLYCWHVNMSAPLTTSFFNYWVISVSPFNFLLRLIFFIILRLPVSFVVIWDCSVLSWIFLSSLVLHYQQSTGKMVTNPRCNGAGGKTCRCVIPSRNKDSHDWSIACRGQQCSNNVRCDHCRSCSSLRPSTSLKKREDPLMRRGIALFLQ